MPLPLGSYVLVVHSHHLLSTFCLDKMFKDSVVIGTDPIRYPFSQKHYFNRECCLETKIWALEFSLLLVCPCLLANRESSGVCLSIYPFVRVYLPTYLSIRMNSNRCFHSDSLLQCAFWCPPRPHVLTVISMKAPIILNVLNHLCNPRYSLSSFRPANSQ